MKRVITRLKQAARTKQVKQILRKASGLPPEGEVALDFFETALFEKQRQALMTDEEFREAQLELLANPEAGALIRETGGLRKLRVAKEGRGKSGSLRVVYYLVSNERIWFVGAFAKKELENLTKDQRNKLAKVIQTLPAR